MSKKNEYAHKISIPIYWIFMYIKTWSKVGRLCEYKLWETRGKISNCPVKSKNKNDNKTMSFKCENNTCLNLNKKFHESTKKNKKYYEW